MGKRAGIVLSLVALALMPSADRVLAQGAMSTGAVVRNTELIKRLSGPWTLQLAGGQRRCTVMLNSEVRGNGLLFGIPATCRRSMAFFGQVLSWDTIADGVRLFDRDNKPVIDFKMTAAKDAMIARSAAGDTYDLLPARNQAAAAATVAAAAPPIPVTRPQEITGTYVTDRAPAGAAVRRADQASRSTSTPPCRLVLSDAPGPKAQTARAELTSGCGDNGLLIFAPAGWRMEGPVLVLTARKGHELRFLPSGVGRFIKEQRGEPLSLSRE
jgi:hypothetical protein